MNIKGGVFRLWIGLSFLWSVVLTMMGVVESVFGVLSVDDAIKITGLVFLVPMGAAALIRLCFWMAEGFKK